MSDDLTHAQKAQSNMDAALKATAWQSADQTYAVLAMTEAILSVSEQLSMINDTLWEIRRDRS
jgi:hypothetical protein